MAADADADIEGATEIFRVLAHETRLRLLLLLTAGEQSVGAIDTMTGIGQPGLSQQLAVLRKAGLVATRRVAKQVYYSADSSALQGTAAFLARLSDAVIADKPAEPDRNSNPGAKMSGLAAGFARML